MIITIYLVTGFFIGSITVAKEKESNIDQFEASVLLLSFILIWPVLLVLAILIWICSKWIKFLGIGK